MQRVTKNLSGFALLAIVAFALAACSKKENYGADTSASAIDTSQTSTYSASSTAPMTQDTAMTAATTTKSTTKKSTVKTAPKKTSY